MNEDERNIAATLAAIAGQGGADEELDLHIYAPVGEIDTGALHNLGEGINSESGE